MRIPFDQARAKMATRRLPAKSDPWPPDHTLRILVLVTSQASQRCGVSNVG
jgi:hypothetical protein